MVLSVPELALWVAPVSDLGGVARHILDLADVGLPGWRLAVASPEGPLLDELRRRQVPVHPIPLSGSTPRALHDLRQLVKDLGPAVVHSHLAKADLLVAAATPGLGVLRVSTEHGIAGDARLYNTSAIESGLKRTLHLVRCRMAGLLIAVSESTRHEMERAWRPTLPVRVIRNGVDRPSLADRIAGMRFLSLSRLAPEKNIPALLRAFAIVSSEYDEATLTIAGAGPDLAELRGLTGRLGLNGKVNFPGYLPAAQAVASHDVLVQLSAWENTSYSLLDALVAGLGVVATPVGGNPELLPSRCLVPAGDATQVASCMLAQAMDVTTRPALPPEWPTRAEMAAQIAAAYQEVLNG